MLPRVPRVRQLLGQQSPAGAPIRLMELPGRRGASLPRQFGGAGPVRGWHDDRDTPDVKHTRRLLHRTPRRGMGRRAGVLWACLQRFSITRTHSSVPSTTAAWRSLSSSFCLYFTPSLLMLPRQFCLSLRVGSIKVTGSIKRVTKQ